VRAEGFPRRRRPRPPRTFTLLLLAAFPFTTYIAWLFYRGNPLAVPAVIVAFIATSPVGAVMASRKARTTPEEAYARMVRRSRALNDAQRRKSGGARAMMVVQAPMIFLAVAWFGLGVRVLTWWRHLRQER
jgi:hypothetical protein